MKEKYLPIGTVVTKKGSSKKYMIVGYLPTIYTGKLITYDYSAYPYPEGFILKNQNGYFNHEEIEKIDYMGYDSVEYHQFLSNVMDDKKELSNSDNLENKNNSFSDVKFDENGIVIFDGTTNVEVKEDLDDIQFDENGFVISAGGEKLVNPFVTQVDIESHKQPDENKDMSIFKDYKFDENGFVISDGTIDSVTTDNNRYEFDENGVVISDSDETISSANNSQYQFDENGVVISEGNNN